MRMTASWSGSKRTCRIQVCGAKMRPMASSPPIVTQTYNRRHQTREVRRKAHLLSIVPPRAQGSKPAPGLNRGRCETQASLRRLAAKAPLAFRPLDPFRALRAPDCRRRDEKRPFPLRTKNFSTTQNQPLDRKSPIQVCEPSVRQRRSPSRLRRRSIEPGSHSSRPVAEHQPEAELHLISAGPAVSRLPRPRASEGLEQRGRL